MNQCENALFQAYLAHEEFLKKTGNQIIFLEKFLNPKIADRSIKSSKVSWDVSQISLDLNSELSHSLNYGYFANKSTLNSSSIQSDRYYDSKVENLRNKLNCSLNNIYEEIEFTLRNIKDCKEEKLKQQQKYIDNNEIIKKFIDKAFATFSCAFSKIMESFYKKNKFINTHMINTNLFLLENRLCYWMNQLHNNLKNQTINLMFQINQSEKVFHYTFSVFGLISDFFNNLTLARSSKKLQREEFFGIYNTKITEFKKNLGVFNDEIERYKVNIFANLNNHFKGYIAKNLNKSLKDLINRDLLDFYESYDLKFSNGSYFI